MKLKLEHILISLLGIILLIIGINIASVTNKYKNTADLALQHIKENEVQTDLSKYSDTGISAHDFLEKITVGYNIGNSLDSCPDTGRNDGKRKTDYYETFWGNPVISEKYVDSVYSAGFNAVRIPVTWYYNTYVENGKLVIQQEWLKRVKEVVDYAYKNEMYIILDSHHDAPIIWADMDNIDEVSGNLSELWTQIAEYFKDYDEHLAFEAFNEINTKHDNWQYNEGSVNATNILNQVFVDTVRKTGGNNSTRILLCDTYLNEATDEVLEGFIIPTDTVPNKLALSVHSYAASYNQDIVTQFKKLQSYSKKIKTPVVITEFGTTNTFVPIEYRSKHASNYIACANEYDIKCFWWDDGGNFKLIERESGVIIKQDIIDALMNPRLFVTKKTSTNRFNTMDSFNYGIISPEDGTIAEFSKGALTFNHGGQGYPVVPRYGYNIVLNTSGSGDGLALSGIAFYDVHMNFIEYKDIKAASTYDVTPPSEASYMRICFYNPWGTRSNAEYMSYFQSNALSLEITEYIKE